jgi:hypothetical protein
VLINYIDHIGLSVAAPQITDVFYLNAVELGLLFSAFACPTPCFRSRSGWCWTASARPRSGPWGAFLWRLASVITALSSGFAGIFVARILLGVAQTI